MEPADGNLLHAGIVFLAAAVVMVPVAQRLRIGAVLGYLLAGIAIGPWGLGFIKNVNELLHFSELGVVFLMFLIGLELNPRELWKLRRSIFGTGTAQVVFSALILGVLLWLTDFSWQAAVVGGLGMAMSSTAMALQLMDEKGMTNNDSGQMGFSVLLFQDMAVIPILAVIPLLGGEAAGSDWYRIGIKILAFAGLLIGGRYLLRPLFRLVVKSGVSEVFTAASLLVVIGSAVFMEQLGFSMALGTFIAGVMLADTEYRHELEITIEPFKGLLLGMFFISVGMSLNIGVLWQYLPQILLGVIVLVSVKMTVLYLLAYLTCRRSGRLQFAGVLSQGGEFAFVLFSAALASRVITDHQMALLLVVVTLSMMTTPLLMQGIDMILARRYNNAEPGTGETPFVEDNHPHVILVGFGRMGQVIGRLLMANKIHPTVLEKDVSAVSAMRRYGYKVYYGDATGLALLRSAGAETAKVIVITCDKPEDTMTIVQLCQEHFPHLQIIARARGRVEAHELLTHGVTQFSRETFSSALELARKTLIGLGTHPAEALRAQQLFRRLDMQLLRELIPQAEEEVSHISRVKEARRELENLFDNEMKREKHQPDSWNLTEDSPGSGRTETGAEK